MLRIMVIRKKEDDERPVFGVGQVLEAVPTHVGQACQVDETLQEAAEEGEEHRVCVRAVAYNRDEEGVELYFHGKLKGGRKLHDHDVVRLRRNEEQLSYNQWAKIYGVVNAVIWNAVKGYTYKHLNWRYPPLR